MDNKTKENPEINEDIQKSLDENLENMENIIKSGSGKDMDEYMKDPENRKKAKAALSKYDEDEKEEVESDMKKSFDDAIEENDSVIDAVPVLKSFANVLESVVSTVEKIESKLSSIEASSSLTAEFQKSMVEVIKSETEIVKSMQDAIELYANAPKAVKGKDFVNTNDGKTIIKSEDGQQTPSFFSKSQIQAGLMNGFQEGKIPANSISKWEMSGFKFKSLSESDQLYIANYINGGKL